MTVPNNSSITCAVSICIPTYNGAETISHTLDSIVSQAFDGLEIVVCDDCSRDKTVEVALEYAHKYSYIRAISNAENLGMDRNFARTVMHAKGKYVWLSGQDDVFETGAIEKLRAIIAQHPDTDIVYFNYRFLSGDLTKEVEPPRLTIAKDAYLTSAEEYFRVIDHAPTFLAATVMRRAFWDTTPYEKFFDTHYVQMGVVLYNLAASKTYVVADPRFIVCRIPEESWKLHGGQMLFEIFSGTLDVYDSVRHCAPSSVPISIYRSKVREFVRNLPIYAVLFGARGFNRTPIIDARMRRLFGANHVLYWFYVWPLLRVPRWLCVSLLIAHRSSMTRWLIRGAREAVSWLASRRLV